MLHPQAGLANPAQELVGDQTIKLIIGATHVHFKAEIDAWRGIALITLMSGR